jgi:hypothetical protein
MKQPKKLTKKIETEISELWSISDKKYLDSNLVLECTFNSDKTKFSWCIVKLGYNSTSGKYHNDKTTEQMDYQQIKEYLINI